MSCSFLLADQHALRQRQHRTWHLHVKAPAIVSHAQRAYLRSTVAAAAAIDFDIEEMRKMVSPRLT
jgi:hypothetical protein